MRRLAVIAIQNPETFEEFSGILKFPTDKIEKFHETAKHCLEELAGVLDNAKIQGIKHYGQKWKSTVIQTPWENEIIDDCYRLGELRYLQKLDLARSEINDEGMRHLAALTNLQELDLKETQIGDSGLACLAGLKNLRVLDISRTRVGDGSANLLAQMDWLLDLYLRESRISEAGLKYLKERLAGAAIYL